MYGVNLLLYLEKCVIFLGAYEYSDYKIHTHSSVYQVFKRYDTGSFKREWYQRFKLLTFKGKYHSNPEEMWKPENQHHWFIFCPLLLVSFDWNNFGEIKLLPLKRSSQFCQPL